MRSGGPRQVWSACRGRIRSAGLEGRSRGRKYHRKWLECFHEFEEIISARDSAVTRTRSTKARLRSQSDVMLHVMCDKIISSKPAIFEDRYVLVCPLKINGTWHAWQFSARGRIDPWASRLAHESVVRGFGISTCSRPVLQ
jgi:hypothetical protein